MKHDIIWSARAVYSLQSIKEYISQVSLNKAATIVREIVIYAKQLEDFPFMGKIDIRLGSDVRTLIRPVR